MNCCRYTRGLTKFSGRVSQPNGEATACCSLASAARALDTDGEPAALRAAALPVADFFTGGFSRGAFFAAVRLAGAF
jgi:hypothetical protein